MEKESGTNLGIWSRKIPLTAEQLKNRQALFTELQKQYNKTHDTDILWYKMYPLLEDAVKSAICKVNGIGNFIENFDEKVVAALDLLIARYIKRPDYNFSSLPTLAYFAAIWASRKPNVVYEDKEKSYEVLMEEKLMHESHVIDDFYEFDYTNESLYDVDELY